MANEPKCKHKVESKDAFGNASYDNCYKMVVAAISFKGLKDGRTREYVCKTHLNSVIKRRDRLMRISNYDIGLAIPDVDLSNPETWDLPE